MDTTFHNNEFACHKTGWKVHIFLFFIGKCITKTNLVYDADLIISFLYVHLFQWDTSLKECCKHQCTLTHTGISRLDIWSVFSLEIRYFSYLQKTLNKNHREKIKTKSKEEIFFFSFPKTVMSYSVLAFLLFKRDNSFRICLLLLLLYQNSVYA